jgi:hypothetical protein
MKQSKREKIGSNQPIIYTHPFPPTLTPIFLFAPLQPSSQKKNVLGRKNIGGRGGGICSPFPPSHTYEKR